MMLLLFFWPLFSLTVSSTYNWSATHLTRKSNYESSINVKDYLADITIVPFHVLVFYTNLFCSGSLVGSRIVITAASCFVTYTKDTSVYVKYGSNSMISGLTVVKAKEVKLHEFYQRLGPLDNDIAMVFIEEHVKFGSHAKKVLLNKPNTPVPINTWLLISGWGHQNIVSLVENRLIWTEMQVTSDSKCDDVYGRWKTPSNFCVTYAPGRHLSDNGCPVIHDNVLVGILSYGGTDSLEPYMALITNVSYFHMWIVKNAKFFLEKYCEDRFDEYASKAFDSSENYGLSWRFNQIK